MVHFQRVTGRFLPLDSPCTPAYTSLMAPSIQRTQAHENSRTQVRSFRITHTQDALLDREQRSGRASAIIRTLLSLYFNKRIDGVEALVDEEVKKSRQAELERLEQHRARMKAQGLKRKQGA